MNTNDYIRSWYGRKPTADLAIETGLSINAVQKRAARMGCFFSDEDVGDIIDLDAHLQEKKMREPTQAEQTRIEQLLKAEGYNPKLWRLVWAHLKDEQGRKHTVLLKNPEQEAKENAEKQTLLNDLRAHAPKYPATKYRKVTNGHLKLIDIADLHIAKYAIGRDGNVSYDTNTALTRAHAAVSSMLARTSGFPTEKFWFPIGNDVLHIDNKNSTTTKGTHQDSIGLWWQAFRAAKGMYVEVIERLAKVAPVEVFYNSSNHDEHLGFCLAEVLEAHFCRAKNVTFTIEPQNDRIYREYGQSMVGFDHGDGAKDKDLPLLMACEEPQMWARCPHRYLMRHHLHHWSKREYVAGKDMPGVTLQYMRSPSAADHYHQKHGYISKEAIDSFVFCPEAGQVAHLSCTF